MGQTNRPAWHWVVALAACAAAGFAAGAVMDAFGVPFALQLAACFIIGAIVSDAVLTSLPLPAQTYVCHFCDLDRHVHDVNSGRCITTWCACTKAGVRS